MITQNRWQHILGVARQAKALAQKLKPENTQYAEDMFLLGLLHDFGYEFMAENQGHAAVGGAILQRNNYKYWAEVAQHGSAQTPMNDELYLLNCADMTTGPTGENFTMQERLDEIGLRHGQNSAAYIKTKEEIKILQQDKRYTLIFSTDTL